MELLLRPEVEALVEEELRTGRFEDLNQLIETAILVLRDSTPHDVSTLNAKIKQGLDDLERGDVFTEAEAHAYLAAMRSKL